MRAVAFEVAALAAAAYATGGLAALVLALAARVLEGARAAGGGRDRLIALRP